MDKTKVRRLSYQDLSRLEVDRFHQQSGISLVDMSRLKDAVDDDGEIDMSRAPNIPLHRLDSALLWLAVQRRSPGATWEQALGGAWEWDDVDPEPADPKGSEQTGGSSSG